MLKSPMRSKMEYLKNDRKFLKDGGVTWNMMLKSPMWGKMSSLCGQTFSSLGAVHHFAPSRNFRVELYFKLFRSILVEFFSFWSKFLLEMYSDRVVSGTDASVPSSPLQYFRIVIINIIFYISVSDQTINSNSSERSLFLSCPVLPHPSSPAREVGVPASRSGAPTRRDRYPRGNRG